MKTSNRFLLGVLSSLLFAAGFLRAANHFDPMSRDLPDLKSDTNVNGAAGCVVNCDDAENVL